METEEIETFIPQTTADLIKEAAIKAAAGALVGIAVHMAAEMVIKRVQKRFKKNEVIETTATEA